MLFQSKTTYTILMIFWYIQCTNIYIFLFTFMLIYILILSWWYCLFPRHVKYVQIYSVFFATLEFSYMFFNYTFVDMVHSKLCIYMHGYCNYIICYFKKKWCLYICLFTCYTKFFLKKLWSTNLCAYLIYYEMWLSLIVVVSFHLSTSWYE